MKTNIFAKQIIFVLFIATFSAKAQFIEDALRFTIPHSMISPRSASLGAGYYGLSDDASALFFNPAGLSFIGHNEFSVGLGFNRNSSNTDYLANQFERRSNSAYITHIAIAMPIETRSKPILGAIAYFHENNYENHFDYSAFNTYSSIIYSLTQNGPQDPELNIPVWLAIKNLLTPIKDSVLQRVSVDEDGGLHNLSAGFSIQILPNVSLGASIQGKWGTYKYQRAFTEEDTFNKYNFFDSTNYSNVDFEWFRLNEFLSQKISGISGSIGLFTTLENFLRFGAVVKFPTYYQIEEEFRQDAYVKFDDGREPHTFEQEKNSYNSYKVTTPFVFCAGLSIKVTDFIFTGGVEYFDVTQLRFSDALPNVEMLNSAIVRTLVGQVNWGLGLVYSVPILPIEFRGSFSSITSPYQKDISGASTYIYSLGAAINIASNARLEPTFQYLTNSIIRTNYTTTDNDPSANYVLKAQPFKIGLQFTYRF